MSENVERGKAWILVGMMGVGKTTIAQLIGRRTGRTLYDLDRMLVNRLGRPVPQLFAIYGEDTFRAHETAVLKLVEPGESIVSTGGGIVLKEQNWEIMRQLGTVIWVTAPSDVLLARLAASRKRRPLLEVENPEERILAILEQREHLYRKADHVVEIGDAEANGAANLVLEALGWTP